MQCLVTSHVLQHKCQHISLKKTMHRGKRKKKEVSEHVNLLFKRIKEAKENYQEQIAKKCRLNSWRASTCKSEGLGLVKKKLN